MVTGVCLVWEDVQMERTEHSASSRDGSGVCCKQLASACMGQTWPHMHAHAAARDTARAQGACPAIAAGGAERHNTR